MNLLLDIDGTLWNTTDVIADAWRSGAQALGVDGSVITADNLKKEFGKTMDVIFSDLYPDITDKELLARIDQEFTVREEQALSALTADEVRDILYPDVVSVIEDLSNSHSLFIVSNCQQGYIEQFMDKSGTEQYITDHLCYGDTGRGKGDNIITLMDRNKISPDNTFYVGDTKLVLDKIHSNFDTVIVDPPRAGLDKKVVDDIIKISPSTLVYLSCDPMTLARDLKLLSEKYEIIEVTPYDMFPNTYHVETLVLLKKY